MDENSQTVARVAICCSEATGMMVRKTDTAIVFIDPQNDVLSEHSWRTSASSRTLRALLEQGFEVAVVKDATAGPRHPVWGDGYQAAMINYQFIAHAVWSSDEALARMQAA